LGTLQDCDHWPVRSATNQKKAHPTTRPGAPCRKLAGVWRLLPRRLSLNHVDLATSSFNSSQRALGRVIHLEGNLLGSQASRTDEADAVLGATDHPRSDQRI